MYAVDLEQAHTRSMIATSAFVSLYKTCLLDAVGNVLLVSPTPLNTTVLLPPLLSSTKCFGVGLCICFNQLMGEASLMTTGFVTDL